MTRPAKPVRPRHAASLVLLRKTARGPQVLMGRRPRTSSFAPDVFVFPGGKVDPADYHADTAAALAPDCAALCAGPPRLAHALAAAALRETQEETGLVLPADHSVLRLTARAITPTNSPIRFHARFFTADADLATGEAEDGAELADLAWRSIDDALRLPIIDVTEAVLHAISSDQGPFLFGYRYGAPHVRRLKGKGLD